jgi:predicted metal-dependent hydrolase
MMNTIPEIQPPLPFAATEGSVKRTLEERLGRPLLLHFTENSTSMLSARIRNGLLCVRLHRMFLRADDRIFGEIVSFLRNRKASMPHFRSFIRSNRKDLLQKPPRKVPVRTRGRFHDIGQLYREINREYFGEEVTAAITWGSRSPRAAVKKRTVGSYSERSNTIRINPVLDRRNVPRCYVAFIVYHEMLHAAMGTVQRGKRRSVHSREFRRREKLFREYEKAEAWESGKT